MTLFKSKCPRRISDICLLLVAISIHTPVSHAQSLGQWSAVIPLPAIPIAAALLPNGKVLGWSSNDLFAFEGDIGDSPSGTYVFLRQSSGQTSLRLVRSTRADMFCPGTAFLPNGQLLVNGGSSSPKTSIYTPSSNSFSSDAEMNVPRGYNSDVLLSNGLVFTLGGSWSGNATVDKIGELWAPGKGWTQLVGVSARPITGPDPDDTTGAIYRGDNHAWLFAVRVRPETS